MKNLKRIDVKKVGWMKEILLFYIKNRRID